MARKMKDSGIEWIGKIPSNYQLIPLKYMAKYNSETLTESTALNYEFDYVDIGSVTYGKGIERYQHMQFKDAPSRARRIVKKKDVILSTVRTYLRATASIPDNEYPIIVSTGFLTLTANSNIIPDYLKYAIQYDGFISEVENRSVGISYPAINSSDAVKIKIIVPPMDEQEQIANFLDKKCAEIDAISTDIQSQINILEDYKKSVIFTSLTKGLNGERVKVTDSGVWETIPKSWELKNIKYVFEIVKRIAGKEGYDILSVTQKGLKVKDISNNEGQIAESYSGYQFVYPTDYVMNHMDLLTGWVDCSTMFGVTSPDYRVFRLQDKKKNNLDYFKYLMQCCYMNRIFYSLGQGVSNLGRWRLQTSTFLNFKIPVPPFEEQNQIAKYLEKKCMEIDAVFSEKQKQLETLEQYKKSLIYEYVTGKREVL